MSDFSPRGTTLPGGHTPTFPRPVEASCASEPYLGTNAQVGNAAETRSLTKLHTAHTRKDPQRCHQWRPDVSGACPKDVHPDAEHNP